MKKNGAYQGMRAIAFLMVFMSHCFGSRFSYAAAWAVSFFFVLSGFLYGQKAYSSEITIQDTVGFIRKKMKRLYPFYFFSIIVSVPYYLLINARGGLVLKDNLQKVGGDFLWCCSLLQSWSYHHHDALIGANWFMSAIVFLYCLTPSLMAAVKKAHQKIGIRFLYFLSAILLVVDVVTYISVIRIGKGLPFLIYEFPLSRVLEYLISIIIGYIFQTCKKQESSSMAALGLCVSGIAVAIMCFLVNYSGWEWKRIIWIVPNLIICVLCSYRNWISDTVLGNQILVSLGNMSFELYLIHCIVALYIVDFTPLLTGEHTWKMQLLVCGLVLVLSIIVTSTWNKIRAVYKTQ